MGDDHKTREFLEQRPELIAEIESCTPQPEPKLITAPPPEIVDKVSRRGKVVNGKHSSTTTGADATENEVDGETMVADIETFITSFVILPPQTSLPLAAWVMATYCYETFDAFPYLLVTSPAPRCGKTRLLEVLSLIVSAPQRTANISESALFRVIQKFGPTLLMDEAENLRGKGERSEYLRGIINAGNRADATVMRCVGKDFNPQQFSVYCPKVVSGIGHFPHTIRDRSIIIGMQRRKTDEKVARFIFREVRPVGETMRWRVQSFINREREQIERAYARLDLQFLEDRESESWEPLFGVLGVADPSRVAELKTCAERLSKDKASGDTDENFAIRLLSDLRDIWPHDRPNILTSELLGLLRGVEESPWASEVDLNPRRLARFLKGFDVKSKSVRVGDRAAKGYTLEDLKAAFPRYLPLDGFERSHGSQPA